MKEFSIDFVTDTITLTKKFYEMAKNYGSFENELLKELKEEYPSMKIEVRRVQTSSNRKNPNKGLTIAYMRKFVKIMDFDNLANFKAVEVEAAELSMNNAEKYIYIKDWFLENYPNYKSFIVESISEKTNKSKSEESSIKSVKVA